MSKEINSIIARVLAGEADVDDVLTFNDWLSQNENNRKEFLQIREYWEASVEVQNPPMPEIAYEKCRERMTLQRNSGRSFLHRMNILSVAASLALFFLGTTVVYLLQKNSFGTKNPVEYYTYMSTGAITEFTLSDGSHVCLNSNSRLTYSDSYGKTDRQVRLDGEAYFDVAKNGTAFKVVIDKEEIEVMGTKFNVRAYSGDSAIVATLESGSILFRSGEQQIMMVPGQQIFFNKTDAVFELQRVETEVFTAWKDEIYKYRSITVQELSDRLEKLYGVKIIVNPKLKDIKVTASFEYRQTIDQVLNVMKKSLVFDWKRKDGIITLNPSNELRIE